MYQNFVQREIIVTFDVKIRDMLYRKYGLLLNQNHPQIII